MEHRGKQKEIRSGGSGEPETAAPSEETGLWGHWSRGGWCGGGGGRGPAEVADDAGGVPGGGEAGAGFVAADAEDEAVRGQGSGADREI